MRTKTLNIVKILRFGRICALMFFVCSSLICSQLFYSHKSIAQADTDLIRSTSTNNKGLADYTILVYLISSDLQDAAARDIIEMEKAVPTSKINIILETGGGGEQNPLPAKKTLIDFSSPQRSIISNGKIQTIMYLDKVNMGQSRTLSDFITWGISKFPARNYAIFFWDHGSGVNGFGNDLNFNDTLTPYELQLALQESTGLTHKKFELIGFDACLMASIEILNHIYPYGNYMVFSEELVPSWGWDYTTILNGLNSNSEMNGAFLGKLIVDSYFQSSKQASQERGLATDRGITMSVMNLSAVPQLVNRTMDLSNALSAQITDHDSAISLSRVIDFTENYGQSATGSSGLVDFYDLTTNLRNAFPLLTPQIEALRKSISEVVIYNSRGDAKVNAHGISVYIPLQKGEYGPSLQKDPRKRAELFSIVPWFRIAINQFFLISNDNDEPKIKSISDRSHMALHTDAKDVSTVVLDIATNSSRGPMLIYRQYIDPAKIDPNGFLTFSENKIWNLCSTRTCIPTSMKIDSNRDKKFVIIPVRIESESDKINENVSLIFEMNNDKFLLLGASPEINPTGAVPKMDVSLKPGYKIYSKAFNQYPIELKKNLSNSLKSSSNLVEDGPLVIDSVKALSPAYVTVKSPLAMTFTFCDYSDNCFGSRWYTFRTPVNGSLLKSDYGKNTTSEELYESKECNESSSNGTLCQYSNNAFGFKLQYPQDWDLHTQNLCDNSSYSFNALSDPTILKFSPKNISSIPGTEYETAIILDVTDSPLRQSVRTYFDYLKSPSARSFLPDIYEITQLKSKTINGNPAFEFVLKYNSSAEEKFGVSKERTEKFVTLLIDKKLYNFVLSTYSTEFKRDQITLDWITNSISSNPTNYIYSGNCNIESGMTNLGIAKGLFQNITYSTMSEPKYHYQIQYPVSIGFGKPADLSQFSNGNLSGYYFTLSDEHSFNDRGLVSVTVDSFNKEEVQKMEQNSDLFAAPTPFNIIGLKAAIEKTKQLDPILFVGYHFLSENLTSINGNPAVIIDYTYLNPLVKGMTHDKIFYTIVGNRLFVLHFSSDIENYPYYTSVFDHMANSLQIVP